MAEKFEVIKDLPTLARIYHTSKKIYVSPQFLTLDELIQEFILIQLPLLVKLMEEEHMPESLAFIEADKKTLTQIFKRHPNINTVTFIKNFEASLSMQQFNPLLSQVRVEQLLKLFSMRN